MNILYLLADQMRYDALSCNGAPICRTPNLDVLAKEGTRFTHAYTSNALCSPSRASILTGLYPHNHGQLANAGNFNGVFDQCMLNHETYFSLLKAKGYQTGYIGKWHLEKDGDGNFWGIDRWHPSRDFHRELQEQGIDYDFGIHEVQPLEWGEDAPFCGSSVLDTERHHDAWVTQHTIDTLEQFKEGAPFVICASFHGPHFPYAVPDPYDHMYDSASVSRPDNFDEMFMNKPGIQQKELMRWNTAGLTWLDWQRVIATYWGYCSYIDMLIGRIIAELREQGLYEETMIIFSADHGDMLGNHRLFNKGFNMYEEDYRVPLLIRWPGSDSQGIGCDAFVSLTDLMPTILAAAEVAPPAVDGRSLKRFLIGETVKDWRDDVYCEFNGYETTLLTSRMVRTTRWKYVYNPYDLDELYDMQSDPGELHNLARLLAFSHVLRRMKERLVYWLRRTGDSIIETTAWQSNSYGLILSDRER